MRRRAEPAASRPPHRPFFSLQASQTSWFVDARGRNLVNEIIRLEDLEASWPRLQRAICGLKHVGYDEMRTTRTNPSSHGHYADYYDERTRDLVAAYAGPDLTRFGYSFEAEPPGSHARRSNSKPDTK